MGFLPMAVNVGIGGEVQRPLVAMIFGGLIRSLALTLITLPVVYLLFNHDRTTTGAEAEWPLIIGRCDGSPA